MGIGFPVKEEDFFSPMKEEVERCFKSSSLEKRGGREYFAGREGGKKLDVDR